MHLTSISLFVLALCRAVIGLTFGISCIAKLRDVNSFQLSIHQMKVIPVWAEVPAIWCCILAEFLVAILLLFGSILLLPGLLLAIFLLLLFSGVLGLALARRLSTSCNCFGSNNRPISFTDLLRNASLLIFAVLGSGIVMWYPQSLESVLVIEWLLIGPIAGILVISLTQMNEIIQLFN